MDEKLPHEVAFFITVVIILFLQLYLRKLNLSEQILKDSVDTSGLHII